MWVISLASRLSVPVSSIKPGVGSVLLLQEGSSTFKRAPAFVQEGSHAFIQEGSQVFVQEGSEAFVQEGSQAFVQKGPQAFVQEGPQAFVQKGTSLCSRGHKPLSKTAQALVHTCNCLLWDTVRGLCLPAQSSARTGRIGICVQMNWCCTRCICL